MESESNAGDTGERRDASPLWGRAVWGPLAIVAMNLLAIVASFYASEALGLDFRLFTGVVIAQPAVYAAWAVLAIQPPARRLPYGLLATWLSFCILTAVSWYTPWAAQVMLGVFFVWWAVLSVRRRHDHESLNLSCSVGSVRISPSSFTIADLLLWTTVAGILLGSFVWMSQRVEGVVILRPILIGDPSSVWSYSLLMAPPLVASSLILRQELQRRWYYNPHLLGCAALVGVVVVFSLVFRPIALITYGSAFALTFSNALALRWAGYRLNRG